MLKFIDLCAGIGGFHAAFSSMGAQCELTCEIDKFARQTYLSNFQTNNMVEDITKINEKEINDFDILCAGFPCQAFSLAGRQRGFADTRGTIFFDVARILQEKRPKAFLLENVKNLKSHDKGNTFKVIENTLSELNYWHKTFTINAKHFVPQKRERIYIVGLDKSKYSEEVFLNMTKDIETAYTNKQKEELPIFKNILEQDVKQEYILSDKLWSFLQSHSLKHKEKGNGFGFGLMTPEDITSRTLTARYYKDGSEILIQMPKGNPRRLSPKECSNLMGYPSDYKIVVSKTQAYKQFGNSVVVPVVTMLARHIVNTIKK